MFVFGRGVGSPNANTILNLWSTGLFTTGNASSGSAPNPTTAAGKTRTTSTSLSTYGFKCC